MFHNAAAQDFPVDTTGIYGERRDSLEAAVFVDRQAGNFLSKGKEQAEECWFGFWRRYKTNNLERKISSF